MVPLSYVQTPRRNLTSNRFLLGIVRAWDAIKTFLHKQMPDTWDGWLNQPLLANSLVRDSVGNVLGLRNHDVAMELSPFYAKNGPQCEFYAPMEKSLLQDLS